MSILDSVEVPEPTVIPAPPDKSDEFQYTEAEADQGALVICGVCGSPDVKQTHSHHTETDMISRYVCLVCDAHTLYNWTRQQATIVRQPKKYIYR